MVALFRSSILLTQIHDQGNHWGLCLQVSRAITTGEIVGEYKLIRCVKAGIFGEYGSVSDTCLYTAKDLTQQAAVSGKSKYWTSFLVGCVEYTCGVPTETNYYRSSAFFQD